MLLRSISKLLGIALNTALDAPLVVAVGAIHGAGVSRVAGMTADESLLPFKKGGFVLVQEAGIPLVPLVVTLERMSSRTARWQVAPPGLAEAR